MADVAAGGTWRTSRGGTRALLLARWSSPAPSTIVPLYHSLRAKPGCYRASAVRPAGSPHSPRQQLSAYENGIGRLRDALPAPPGV